jgi:hypothetical protein
VQVRFIFSGSSEWSEIIFSVENIKERSKTEDNEVGEQTCEELLEAFSQGGLDHFKTRLLTVLPTQKLGKWLVFRPEAAKNTKKFVKRPIWVNCQ